MTLLEVTISSALVATVMTLSLSQVREATDVTNATAAESDLRRTAENVLVRLVRDLRSTQAQFVATDGTSIELYRIADYEPIGETPLLDGPLGPVPPPTLTGGGDPYVYRYAPSSATANGGRNGVLELRRGTASSLGTATPIALSFELPPPSIGGGLTVSKSSGGLISTATPPLLTGGPPFLSDAPTTLSIKLSLRRRIGSTRTSSGALVDSFVNVAVATEADLRASRRYH